MNSQTRHHGAVIGLQSTSTVSDMTGHLAVRGLAGQVRLELLGDVVFL